MANMSLQSVFRAARPTTTAMRDPSVFLRRCRALHCPTSSSSSSPSSPFSRVSSVHPKPLRVVAAAVPTAQQWSSSHLSSCRHPRRHRNHRRSFSSTAATAASTTSSTSTVVVKNPRVDEEGNDMTIEISDRAAKRLRQITSAAAGGSRRNTLAPASPPDSHLRVTVTSGGCHGFQYLMSLEGPSKIDEDEDTVFVAREGDGGEGEADKSKGKAVVVMDEPSLELLKGSTVDFTTELIGSQFKIVGNPRATSSCGCGTSFDIA